MKKNSLIIISIAILIIILIFVFGNKKNTQPETATVSGTVTYLEKRALPENSTLTVELRNTSSTTEGGSPIASQIITTGGNQVPIPFSIIYNVDAINPESDYFVFATIAENGQALWTTPAGVPVITQENPRESVEIIVKNQPSKMYQTKRPVRFEKTDFTLISVNGKFINGPYTATFTDGQVSAKFCNGMGGEYSIKGNIVTAPALVSTMMFCETPEGLMEAEQVFSKILSEGAKITITETVLELNSGDQKIVFLAK